jgi:DNA-directed RNA polymerase specialized sigma24 family protein
MPRTREQLEKAAAEATQWLDDLDPDDPSVSVEDAADLRAVGLALAAISASEKNLAATVAAARANGRSWSRIAAVLGVSKQAAMRRFGEAHGANGPRKAS